MGLGHQLREARVLAGLTITDLAERAGFSPSYISQVERDLANPSVGAVNRIAEALGVRMSAFFSDGAEPETRNDNRHEIESIPTEVVRRDRRKGLTYPGSNVRHELLTPSLQRALQILIIRAPIGSTHGDETISHEGEECSIVLKGVMELTVEGEVFVVEAGDTIYFDARKPHSWRSMGPEELEAIFVMTPPHF
jgi:transcriptional regulator with XRE-family HTH domain